MTQQVAAPRGNCFCKGCGARGFKRTEMTVTPFGWYCPKCDAGCDKRGSTAMREKTSSYWDQNSAHIAVVTDDKETPPATPSQAPPTKTDGKSKGPKADPTQVKRWRADVYATKSLDPDGKLLLLKLEEEWADYGTGANIWPSISEIMSALGWSRRKVFKVLKLTRAWYVPHPLSRRGARGGNSHNLYQLRRPSEATHGLWEGPIRCTKARWLTLKAPKAVPLLCSR